MKYSIIISPKQKKSNTINHALAFIQAILKHNNHEISVFFYGHAVEFAFVHDSNWQNISKNNVALLACSTIAESYLTQQQKLVDYIDLAGLGQWMESVCGADKNIEFT